MRFLTESLRGFEAAHGDVVRLHHDPVYLGRSPSSVTRVITRR